MSDSKSSSGHSSNHEELYKHAHIYDVAFAYRDFGAELDFLVAAAKRWGSVDVTSFLEVAAGPGIHALVAAERGLRSMAMDLAPAMMELCEAKARERKLTVRTLVADMRHFDVDEPTALAFNPITSISYLRTREALVDHMKAMARAVVPGGVYVVENNHPKDFLRGEHFVPSVWTMTGPGAGGRHITVETTWIAEAPPKMNAAAQLYEAVGRYRVIEHTSSSEVAAPREVATNAAAAAAALVIEDRAWLRMTLPAEVALAADAAGFDVAAELGDLHVDKPLDDDGWRAVTVLRRR